MQLSTDKGGEHRSRNSLRVRQILQVRIQIFRTRSRKLQEQVVAVLEAFFRTEIRGKLPLLNRFINRARANKKIRPRSANGFSL